MRDDRENAESGTHLMQAGEASWHALPADDVVALQSSRETGLSETEADARLGQYGANAIPRPRGDGPLVLLWRQLNNPLIWVLLGSGAIAIAMGKLVDGAVVLGVVVLNTLIGFVQEYRAGKAIEALASMVPQTAAVLRDGKKMQLPAEKLVPGDLVTLQSGDKVPADVRLLELRGLRIDEAALTGESAPVEKGTGPVPEESALGDRRNMAYGGTLVTSGTTTAIVIATGARTELGRISSMLHEATDLATPLTRSMATIGKWLTVAILVVAAALAGVGLWRGYPLVDALLAAITLAVAAIPEGLPAVITIALAIGVRRMARRRAIIRRLPAVETLGSTTVICSDKTGTLTRNEMTVQALWSPRLGERRITGVGYEPRGELMHHGKPAGQTPDDLRELLSAAVLCSDATLRGEEGTWHIAGDPTEAALVVAAEKLGVRVEDLRQSRPRLDAIPFESERQFMATLHRESDGAIVHLKGAPEVVLRRCRHDDPAIVLEQVSKLAARGMRVLAIARRRWDAQHTRLSEADTKGEFELLGLVGMIDPPRQEAIDAVAACQRAGIVVKMITGDHKITAEAIGRQLGLLSEADHAIDGPALERMDDQALARAALATHVFARVAPEHKLRLVRALQAQGHVVAMTGDGVNDAPALKQANIGVAMGITGTAVSRESADIVLADDNFASIAAAVEEGRRVYDNLVKSLAFILPTNLGLALILLSAVLFFPQLAGQPLLPMRPTQILWINLVAAVALALPLAFEAMERDVMKRPPRRPDAPLLSGFVIQRTMIVGVLMAGGAIGLFLYEYHREVPRVGHAIALAEAQTMAVLTVVLFQVFYLLNCRSLRESVLQIGLFSNRSIYAGIGALLVLQVALMYVPAMNTLFGTMGLNVDAWVKSALVAAVILPVISIEKWIRNWMHEHRHGHGEHSAVLETRPS